MGLFDWLKPNNKNITTYWPGGKRQQVYISYDSESKTYKYKGRFSSLEKFREDDIKEVIITEIDSMHGVVVVQGETESLATFDILPMDVCHNSKTWLDSGRTIQPSTDPKGSNPSIMDLGMDDNTNSDKKNNNNNNSNNNSNNNNDNQEMLAKLDDLYQAGLLDNVEYESKKEKILKKK